jgi:hypothetical protein
MGPVPKNFGGIFDYAVNHNYVNSDVVYFENGNVGEQFVPNGQKSFDKFLFNSSEMMALEDIANKFKQDSVKDIIDKSHEEAAWKENVEGYKEIDYRYGFDLIY